MFAHYTALRFPLIAKKVGLRIAILLKVFGDENIREVIDFLNGENNIEQTIVDTCAEFYARMNNNPLDFSDVKGRENVKRALEIAAAGEQNIILIGPRVPGKPCWPKGFLRFYRPSP